MTGSYTEIFITARESAEAGATISVVVGIKNILDHTIYATPVLNVNGVVFNCPEKTITPGETQAWTHSFIMPNGDAIMTVDSWCESYYFDFQLDYSIAQTVTLIGESTGTLPDIIPNMISLMIVVMMMGMMTKVTKGV